MDSHTEQLLRKSDELLRHSKASFDEYAAWLDIYADLSKQSEMMSLHAQALSQLAPNDYPSCPTESE